MAKVTGNKFDLIVTDLNMPQMDGIQMITAVRKLPGYSFIPILMLTTESQAEKKDAGKKAGATGWIVKPFNEQQLISVIQKLVK
ncbi:MAG: response regulator [Candidatus Sulfotelmatobacter sp.]|jgi:two-component system, chemotaxis family, chemotaxis protein CheY